MPPLHLVVAADEAGRRLDRYLAAHLPALSRSAIQRLIRTGAVQVGAKPAKPGQPLTGGLQVAVTIPEPTPATPLPEDLPLAVLHNDPDLIVIDKAAGMVVHPAAGHTQGTLVNALLHHVTDLSGVGGATRPGIVHRLDRGTSGVLVVAKHDLAHRELARQFHDREVVKEYVALVWGTPKAGTTLDRPIGRDPRHRQKMSSRAGRARAATTTITQVEPLGPVSLVRLTIGTGRTHQIRVHLSEAGFPVVGDPLYGAPPRSAPARLRARLTIGRPCLHASRLTLTHPRSHQPMTFDAPIPADFTAVIAELRRVPTSHPS